MLEVLIYTAGPIRAKTEALVAANLRRAKDIARAFWGDGISTICPHANTDLNSGDMPVDGYEGEADWIAGDLVQVRRCDALFLCHGWEHSTGTLEEKAEARAFWVPTFTNRWKMELYLRNSSKLKLRFFRLLRLVKEVFTR